MPHCADKRVASSRNSTRYMPRAPCRQAIATPVGHSASDNRGCSAGVKIDRAVTDLFEIGAEVATRSLRGSGRCSLSGISLCPLALSGSTSLRSSSLARSSEIPQDAGASAGACHVNAHSSLREVYALREARRRNGLKSSHTKPPATGTPHCTAVSRRVLRSIKARHGSRGRANYRLQRSARNEFVR